MDDETIASLRLPPDGQWVTAEADIPPSLCTPGEHDLRLRVPSTGSVPGLPRAGVAVDWYRLGPADDPALAPPPPLELSPPVALPVLSIPDGWTARYAFEALEGYGDLPSCHPPQFGQRRAVLGGQQAQRQNRSLTRVEVAIEHLLDIAVRSNRANRFLDLYQSEVHSHIPGERDGCDDPTRAGHLVDFTNSADQRWASHWSCRETDVSTPETTQKTDRVSR